jgi:hypothetical protein
MREMPEITAEAMQNMMPLMRKSMESLNQRLQEEIAAMLKDFQPEDKKPATQKTTNPS